uniref:Uncharacterized protein n=1 Tax=Arundo donax TaxID=35708 RepID=A0A0A8YDX8_ARUDO
MIKHLTFRIFISALTSLEHIQQGLMCPTSNENKSNPGVSLMQSF